MNQPDWIEVGHSQYSCGNCNEHLDLMFVYPNTEEEDSWLACPHCGWEERTPDMPTVENEWYQERYGEKQTA